jgi:hypothetical protein
MKKIIGIIVLAAVLVGGWMLFMKDGQPTITTEDDAVAATVNGEEITGEEVRAQIEKITAYQNTKFFQMSDEARQTVYNEALDTLIQAEVLAQTVKAAGVSVSSEAIDASVQAAADAVGGMEALEAQLAAQGEDLKQFRRDVKAGLLNQAYFDATLPLTEITVSDGEIQTQFDTWVKNATEANEEIPTMETARSIIENEIRGLKREEMIREHIDTLIEAAAISKT